ncbi:hypothetical protein BJ741DRAFT_589911 [Chytriomyces cf. hyalinus JEL632]|nr:hypothetical protein BJ741DRAFT_589911 [Chytriomyces cf. hyalinus JEL632]
MTKRPLRCTRCVAHHKKCDAEPGGCTRCRQTNSVCTYRQVKSVQLSCARCCSLHKRCDHRREPGCARCKRAGVECVYLSQNPSTEPVSASTLPIACSKTESAFLDSPPASITSKSLPHLSWPEADKLHPFSYIPTTTTATTPVTPVSPLCTNSFPTFSEWSLVYSYFHSTEQHVQQSMAFTLLDRSQFLSTFFAQPSALWLIVCAFAVYHSSPSSDFLKGVDYYNRACAELSEQPETSPSRSFKTMQAAILVSKFAQLLLTDHDGRDSFSHVARNAFLSAVSTGLDVPSQEYEKTRRWTCCCVVENV